MQKSAVLLATLLASFPSHGAPQVDPGAWTPDTATVAKVDLAATQFDLPQEFGPITAYARYYWGGSIKGHRVIEGALITPHVRAKDGGKVQIVTETEAPAFADGGCMFVYLTYDAELEKITEMHCNFELRPPQPQR